MADVTGPISSLPGSRHSTDQMCDEHQDRPAVARIQGETDSFGSEMYDMCQACLDEYRKSKKNRDTSGICEWCKKLVDKRFNERDFEEGMCGPVYLVCTPCINKRNEEYRAEVAKNYSDI